MVLISMALPARLAHVYSYLACKCRSGAARGNRWFDLLFRSVESGLYLITNVGAPCRLLLLTFIYILFFSVPPPVLACCKCLFEDGIIARPTP